MPKFKYTALTIDNKHVSNIAEAKSIESLAKKLREDKIFITQYKLLDEKTKKATYKLKALELSDFSRQISNMTSAGITIVRAVSIMNSRKMKPKLNAVYDRLYESLQDGNVLSTAMVNCQNAFPNLIINMFIAGESSGNLDKTALKMAEHYEKEHKLNIKIKSAMTYPIILLILTIAIVILIFTFVLPAFFDLFKDIELPAITKLVMGISSLITKHWLYLIIGTVVFVILLMEILKIPKIAFTIDKLKVRIPKIGGLMKTIYTTRFARTLSSLYTSGVPMINAIEITATVIGNRYIVSQFTEVIKLIRGGEYLSVALEEINGFDPKLKTVIFIGEESGKLDEMLVSISENLEYESEMATARLVTYIEPIMIVIMAVVIGGIMLSVMLPILSLYQNIG